MTPTVLPSLVPVLPELMLSLGAMALLMLGVFRRRITQVIYGLAIALLLLAAVMVVYLPAGTLTTFGGSFVVDDFARFLKVLALLGSAAALPAMVSGIVMLRASSQAMLGASPWFDVPLAHSPPQRADQ